MALIDRKHQEIHCKIVYYGPGMSGKTTNFQYMYSQLPQNLKSNWQSLAAETERTLFFDFSLPNYPEVRGLSVRFHLYTIPGSVLYNTSYIKLLNKADGIVLVADSQKTKLRYNHKSIREVCTNLIQQQHQDPRTFPIVWQYNKRDVPGCMPLETMDYYLNSLKLPRFAAIAVEGEGVMETLQAICDLVIEKLHTNQSLFST